jgi:uncharacterized protein (DUF2141 family)
MCCLLLSGCAQVVAPGGGKRDDYAPKVVKYSPDSAQLNFNSNVIELTFDEYIQLKDLNNQLIISPPLAKQPDIKVRNKTLTIDLGGQELKPNTTYSINFGNALQDINENNAKENFSYIFSTGSFIDSLKVKGKVETAFDHKTEKSILVMLYSNMNDSAAYKGQPDFFARTATDGSFTINNVKPGKYKIVALKDLNANYKYDGDAEHIGFSDSIVNPSEKKEIRLELFQEHAKKIFIKKYTHPSYGKIVIVFNEGSDSIRVNNLDNDRKGVQEYIDFSRNKDTLTYWLKNYDKDSLRLQVNNGNEIIDTLEFQLIKKAEALKAKRSPLKLALVNNFNGSQSFDLASELKLTFNNPVAGYSGGLTLKEDTTKLNGISPSIQVTVLRLLARDSLNVVEDPNHAGSFVAAPIGFSYTNWKENTPYHLFIPPGALTDIFGLTNDTIQINFKTREAKYYGSLKLKINIPAYNTNTNSGKGRYIVQLMNERDQVVRENFISKPETLNYENLHPSKYHVKIIYDDNGNGKWDPGNYLQKIQPEKILFDPEPITIRSNWDAEIEWNTSP